MENIIPPCTNYVEVQPSIDTVSTYKCQYMSDIYKTHSNGNSITQYDAVDSDVQFIPSDELPDIYSASVSESDWPFIYATATCDGHAMFHESTFDRKIMPNYLPAFISACNSHRRTICKSNLQLPKIPYPRSKKDLIASGAVNSTAIGFNSAYLELYRIIQKELKERLAHNKYSTAGIEPLDSLSPYDVARTYDITIRDNKKTAIVRNQGKMVQIEDFEKINQTLEQMCIETVDPSVVKQLDLETETPMKPQDSINVLIDNAKKVFKDCICYTDCGDYSVCFCYSNCNHY